jgi:hypothetical protein
MRIRSSRRRRSPFGARPFLRERRVPPGAWDALKQELTAHRAPRPVIDAADRAYAEAARLEAALAAPPTTVGSASPMEPHTRSRQAIQPRDRSANAKGSGANDLDQEGDGSDDRPTQNRSDILRWVMVAALAGGGAWLALSETATRLIQPVIQSLTGLV